MLCIIMVTGKRTTAACMKKYSIYAIFSRGKRIPRCMMNYGNNT